MVLSTLHGFPTKPLPLQQTPPHPPCPIMSGNKSASSQVPTMEPDEANKHSAGSMMEYELREYLLLLATLVATVTYAAGLNLPGGAWQENTKDGLAGDSILKKAHKRQYLTFYYCNATAFAASLVVSLIILVLHKTKDKAKDKHWEALLRLVMVLDLLGLMGAYVAGSCRDKFTTIYSALLVCAVFAYIILAFAAHLVSNYVLGAAGLGVGGRTPASRTPGVDAENPPASEDTAATLEELRKVLMLLATFAVTITYVAGLNPPGGFWSDTKDGTGGHQMSDPVLLKHYSSRYQAFYVCNTTAFVASLLIVILLVDRKLSMSIVSVRFVALYGLIITALLGLVGAYAAGSCREIEETIYVVCLIGGVLAYIFLQVSLTKAMKRNRNCCFFRLLASIHKYASKWLRKTRKLLRAGSQLPTGQGQTTGGTDKKETALEKARTLVMLLATLVVSITYQAGLDPPGGLWPDDRDDHKNGDPILLTTHPTRYKVFFYSNSAAFVASLIVIMMVQSRFLLRRHTLEALMILDLFGLISAYAAGSCRDENTSIYVVSLAAIVLVYVVIHIIFFTLDSKEIKNTDEDKLEKRRDVLLLLAILAATLTYQAGLTPPGGFWQDDADEHRAGYPVLHDNYKPRYNAFFYCNAASFMASVALIVLLVNPNLYMPGIRCYALYVCMVMGMFGLMGAYAAGSSRDLRTSIYVLTLVAAVFAFVFLEVIIFWFIPYLKSRKTRGSKKENGSSGQAGSTGTETETPEKKPSESTDKDLREYLMLLGVLAASVTYQSGLKPPGGLWQDDDINNHRYAGSPILHYLNKQRYHAFFYSNSTSFMASIVVIVLLLPGTLHQHSLPLWPMHTAIVLDMLGLLGAYAAGSTRDWKTSKNVIYLVIPVLLYIGACLGWSIIQKKRSSQKGNTDEHKLPGNDEEGQK